MPFILIEESPSKVSKLMCTAASDTVNSTCWLTAAI